MKTKIAGLEILTAVIFSAAVLLNCGAAVAQVSQNAPAPNPNITAPGPQKHQPPSQPQQQLPGTRAPQPVLQAPAKGLIEGFVYWDISLLTHTGGSGCSGLAATVNIDNGLSGPFKGFRPLETLSNNFKYVGQVKTFLVGGKVVTYDVCTYGFGHLPVGPQMQVQISILGRTTFSTAVAPQPSIVSPITIINGQCNMLPSQKPTSVSDLTAHWGSCQNMAYDVNFALQPGLDIKTNAGGGGSGTSPARNSAGNTAMLSGGQQQGMLAPGATQSSQTTSGMLLGNRQMPAAQRGATQNGANPQATPASKVELNPQPLPPGGKTSGLKSQTPLTNGDVIKMVQAGLPKSVIISSVESGEKKFDFSPVGCRSLTAAHISEDVFNAMGDGGVRPCSTEATAAANSPGSDVELNPQPLPPRIAGEAAPGTTAGGAGAGANKVKPLDPKLLLKLGPATSGEQIKNPRIAQFNKATLTVLQSQKSVADVEAAQMKLSLRPAVEPVMLNGPSQTMSSGATGAAISPTAQAPSMLAMNNGTATSGSSAAKISPTITHVSHTNTTALTCINDPTFRILTVSGSAGQATFTPIDQYNLYTVTGCSFGNQDPKNKVYIYGAGTFQANFNIKFWTDNSIALSLDPSISGYPDLDNLSLVVQRSDGHQVQKGGFKFYAARSIVRLPTIPQSWVKLAAFTYRFKTMDANYSSPPTSAPEGPGGSAGTSYVSRFINGVKFDPSGHYDVYDMSQLAPGWTTDSFQINSYDQKCPYVVTYRQTFGTFTGIWDSRGNPVVWLSDTSCSGFNAAFPLYNYQNWTGSYYALKLWVNGPRGVDPFTNKPAQ